MVRTHVGKTPCESIKPNVSPAPRGDTGLTTLTIAHRLNTIIDTERNYSITGAPRAFCAGVLVQRPRLCLGAVRVECCVLRGANTHAESARATVALAPR